MKVNPSEPAQPGAPGPERPAPQEKRFSNVLDRKKQAGQAESPEKGGKGEKNAAVKDERRSARTGLRDRDVREEADAFDLALPAADSGSAAAAVAARLPGFEAERTRAAAAPAPSDPAIVSALVHEITATVSAASTAAVDIQFNSKTLDGLHVRVAKAGEHISVKFTTGSEDVAALLNRNSDSLTAALQNHGFQVGAITVTAEAKEAGSEGHEGERSRSQGVRREGGRERRGR